MASLASMDPKELAKLDPALAALYGLPPGGASIHNGVSKSSSAQGKPKPGTVAAALEEKKKAAAAAAAAAEAAVKASTATANHADPDPANADKTKDNPINQVQQDSVLETPNIAGVALPADLAAMKQQNGGSEAHAPSSNVDLNNTEQLQMTGTDPNEGIDNDGTTKGGLTSEERVLLREKKKARLQKEQEQTWENNIPQQQQQQQQTADSLDGDAHNASITEGSDAGVPNVDNLDIVVDKLQDAPNNEESVHQE